MKGGRVMKKVTFLAGTIFALTVLFSGVARAQQDPPSRVEVGVQFSSITAPGQPVADAPAVFSRTSTEAGFGGRITFNLNKNISLEAEQNYFPHENVLEDSRGGTLWQGHFGVKIGKRFGKWGVFGKARPGFASFSRTVTQIDTASIVDPFSGQTFTFPILGLKRQTHFAMDLGGVIEFYPSRKVLTRIDVGDTIIPGGNETFVQAGNSFQRLTRTTHSLQISAGIGFRFGSLAPEETTSQTHDEKLQRYEVGAQFSSLGLTQIERNAFAHLFSFPDYRDVITQAGFGGRFTVNLTPNFALEAQGDFYPRDNQSFFNNFRAGGRVLQLQAGLKAGKRFEKFGVFAKGRPGVVSFSRTVEIDGIDPTFGFPTSHLARKTYFSLDVGGVLEFYPMRRVFARFDGGDTMIFYPSFDQPFLFFPVQILNVRSEVIHNFQFSAGVGFRF
jgi:hypothetical protein